MTASLDPFVEAKSMEKGAEVPEADVGIRGTSQHTREHRIGHRFIVPQDRGRGRFGATSSLPDWDFEGSVAHSPSGRPLGSQAGCSTLRRYGGSILLWTAQISD